MNYSNQASFTIVALTAVLAFFGAIALGAHGPVLTFIPFFGTAICVYLHFKFYQLQYNLRFQDITVTIGLMGFGTMIGEGSYLEFLL